MRTHTQTFKDNICLFGRELDSIITYTSNNEEIELGNEELNSVTPHYEGSILKSVMKQLDIDSNIDIPLGTILNYQFGVKVGEDIETGANVYDYIDFGNYIVYSSEKQEDTNSYKIVCYDKMLYAMKPYDNENITYPITLKNYLGTICEKLGITFASGGDNFANYNRQITSERYLSYNESTGQYSEDMGYTFRDVLDEIAGATASTIVINENDQLEVRYITETGDTINEDYLKDINVNFGEQYGPVNTIVLSRSADSDNIYYPETLPENPIEIKIRDNQIMNGNDRSDYLPDIYAKLNGLQYYVNDFSSTGICYYDICDRYTIQIDGNSYSCIMLNDEINISQGLEENIHTDLLDQSVTDYTKADKTDRRINQTYLIVDKQNQQISAVVSQVGEQDEQIAEIRLQYNEILSRISDIADITVSGESSYGSVDLLNVNASQPISVKIHPINMFQDNIGYLYPNSRLADETKIIPSDTLYPKTRILRFTNNSEYELTTDTKYTNYRKYYSKSGDTYTLLVAGTDYIIGNTITGTIYQNKYYDWLLPTNIWSYDSTIYDELELSYGDGINSKVIVTRECYINPHGYVAHLQTPTTETYDYPSDLVLTDGDYTVTLLGYDAAYLYVQLMAKNIYTTQFYTRAETNTLVNQTAEEITAEANAQYTRLDGKIDENTSKITINTNSITSEVNRATASEGSLSSRISQTATGISLSVNNGSTTSGITITTTKEDGTTSTSSGTIEMNGLVKFTNLYDGTTTISGSNIKTGTIDASRVNVTNINASNITSGTINGEYIYGGTITGTNLSGAYISGGSMNVNDTFIVNGYGKVYLGTTYGFLSTRYTNHPYASALNVGYGSGGVTFYSGQYESDTGSYLGNIACDTSGAMYINSSDTININHGYQTQIGGNIGIGNLVISDTTINGPHGARVITDYNCRLSPASGYYAYVGTTAYSDRILTNGGSPSSLNVKKNLKSLKKEYDDIYKDIQTIDAYNYDYKYENVKDDLTKDYGFIIDEIENTKHLSKYFRNYDAKRYIDGNKLIKKTDDEEDMSNYKEINIKEWDKEAYIKGLFVMIKTLQHKIDKLEEKINE